MPATKKQPSPEVTQLIDAVKSRAMPWQRAWEPNESGPPPFNPVAATTFHGAVALALEIEATRRGYDDPRWMTFDEALSIGATVRGQQRATRVVLWDKSRNVTRLDENGKAVLDGDGAPIIDTVELDRPVPIYTVLFNADQISDLDAYTAPPLEISPTERATAILKESGVEFEIQPGATPHYDLKQDKVVLPDAAAFKSDHEYFATAIRQIVHSTMHSSRLDNATVRAGVPGSPTQASEELRAAIASCSIARATGIGNKLPHHTDFTDKWADLIELYPQVLTRIANEAQEIAEWVMQPELRRQMHQENERAKLANTIAKETQMSSTADKQHRQSAPSAAPRQAKRNQINKVYDIAAARKEFGDFIRAQGLQLDGDPVMDGTNWHRVFVKGQKGRSASGTYKGYLDGLPNGLVNNWRDSGKVMRWAFTGKSIGVGAGATSQIGTWDKEKAAKETERHLTAEKARLTANRLWNAADPATVQTCPYLAKKGVGAHDVKLTWDGKLVVPARDTSGHIRTVQLITVGQKRFIKGGAKKGFMHVIDPASRLGNETIIIAEGYSTAASIHEATSRPVISAFDAGNFTPVAINLREKYPNADILFAADDDHRLESNRGVDAAIEAAKAVGGRVVVAQLSDELKRRGASDFNDIHQMVGAGQVREQMEFGIARSPLLGDRGKDAGMSMGMSMGDDE